MILLIVLIIFAMIFIAVAGTSLITSKMDAYPVFFKSRIIQFIGGISSFIVIFLSLCLYMENKDLREKLKNKNKYEIVNEQYYRKIN